jgi:hypothetical protein
VRREEKVRRPVLAVKLTFLFFCFFFSPLSELKIRLKSKSFQEQNDETKKKQQTPQKHFKQYTLSVSSLSQSSSLFSLVSSRRNNSVFIREFVLYFESDEKRNKKTAFVSIGLLAKL